MNGAAADTETIRLSPALLLLLPDGLGQVYRSPVSDKKYLLSYKVSSCICTAASHNHVSVVVSPVVLVLFNPVQPVSPPSPSPAVPITVAVDDVPGRPQLLLELLAVRGLHPRADDERPGGHIERPAHVLVIVA